MNPSKKEQLERTPSSPRRFVGVLQQMLSSEKESRRSSGRHPKRLSLVIQPLDDDFLPDGDSFYAISSDLSKRGMGFILDEPIAHSHFRITLQDDDVSVIAVTRHCTSIGIGYPLYLIGVEFLDEYLV